MEIGGDGWMELVGSFHRSADVLVVIRIEGFADFLRGISSKYLLLVQV